MYIVRGKEVILPFLFCSFTFTFTLATTRDTYRNADPPPKVEEDWFMMAKRQMSYFSQGPNIPIQQKYQDETPDPNESWKAWAKRQACEKTKIECCISPYVRIKTLMSSKIRNY